MLGAFDRVEVIGEAADGESALRGINELRPELVFLDEQMPGLLGTDVVRRLERPPFVIFTTAYLRARGERVRARRGGLPAEAVRAQATRGRDGARALCRPRRARVGRRHRAVERRSREGRSAGSS
jgi:chemotaxis response regulator CheB